MLRSMLFVMPLLAVALLTPLPTIQAAETAPAAEPAKFTSQTYVDTLQAELARYKARLERDKADEKIKSSLEAAIAEGDKLLVIVLELIKNQRNFDSADFKRASGSYLAAKRRVPFNFADEIAHLQAWIDANKTTATMANEIKYYESIIMLLKRGSEATEKGNKMEIISAQAQVSQREANADSYHANGQFKGIGPDTARGDYILARLERDPNVTIVMHKPSKPDMSNPAVRNRVMNK